MVIPFSSTSTMVSVAVVSALCSLPACQGCWQQLPFDDTLAGGAADFDMLFKAEPSGTLVLDTDSTPEGAAFGMLFLHTHSAPEGAAFAIGLCLAMTALVAWSALQFRRLWRRGRCLSPSVVPTPLAEASDVEVRSDLTPSTHKSKSSCSDGLTEDEPLSDCESDTSPPLSPVAYVAPPQRRQTFHCGNRRVSDPCQGAHSDSFAGDASGEDDSAELEMAIKRSASEMLVVANLKSLASRQALRRCGASASVRFQVRAHATNFCELYARTCGVLEKHLSLKIPSRSRSISEAEMQNYLLRD